jgi:hypothetical protein
MDERTSGTDIPLGTTRASELNEPSGRGPKDAVREKAREIGQRASERAQTTVSEQKDRATSELGAVAFALRDAATRLEGENMMSGRLIRSAAERLDDFSRNLETRDLDGLLLSTRQWARRNPAAFIGAAVAVGFLASRFLKASEREDSWDGDGTDAYGAMDDFSDDYEGLDYTGSSGYAGSAGYSGSTGSPGTGYGTGSGSGIGGGYTPGSGTGSFGTGSSGDGGSNGRA